jgi:hypothetical protein
MKHPFAEPPQLMTTASRDRTPVQGRLLEQAVLLDAGNTGFVETMILGSRWPNHYHRKAP